MFKELYIFYEENNCKRGETRENKVINLSKIDKCYFYIFRSFQSYSKISVKE